MHLRRLRGLLLLLTALLALSGGALAANVSAEMPTEGVELLTMEDDRLTLLSAGTESAGTREFTGRYYDQLGEDAQALYRVIDEQAQLLLDGRFEPMERDGNLYLTAATDGMKNVSEDNYTDVAAQAVSAYWNDNPRERVLFGNTISWYSWDTLAWQGGTFERDGTEYVNILDVQLLLLDDRSAKRAARLDAAVEAFCKTFAADGMEDGKPLEQYRYIHDYLCRICKYNYDALKSGSTRTERYRMAHCAYGALVELEYGTDDGRGAVVCEGYAQAFELLCQRVGLPCAVVSGDGGMYSFPLSCNHTWNVISLDGAWYAVDVTWDDVENSVSISSGIARVMTVRCGWRYTYFADNRYFTAHWGLPAQDHAAMNQNVFSFSSADYALLPPALTAKYAAETTGWTARSFDVFTDTGSFVSDLTAALNLGTIWLAEARTATIHINGVLKADRTLMVPDGMTYRLVPVGETATIRRTKFYRGTMLTVAAGGTLELDGVTLDGEGAASNAAMLVLANGTEDKRAVAVLRSGALTGGGGRTLDAGENACIRLAGDVALTDSLADGTSSDIRLADSARVVTARGSVKSDLPEQVVSVASVQRDGETVRVSVRCRETAMLVCAVYDADGRMAGVRALEVDAGVHTCELSAPDGDGTLRIFALGAGTSAPLASAYTEALP